MQKTIKLTLILFALHLLYSNTILLLQANSIPAHAYFKLASVILFAGSYSVITVLILTIYPRLWLIFVLAGLDLTGVFLKYAPITEPLFFWLTAGYFSAYTGMIAVSLGLYQNKKEKPEKPADTPELAEKKNELFRLKQRLNPTKNEAARDKLKREIERVQDQIKKLEQ